MSNENKAPEAATETAKPAVVQMPEQNGVRQPRPNTNCDVIWQRANAMSQERNAPVAVADLLEVLVADGFNPATVKTQYARWRKFHGIEGVVVSDKARQKREEAEAKKAAKEAEREAKKKAREEEKARKAAERAEAKAAKEAERKAKAEERAAAKAAKEAEKAAKAEAAKAKDAAKADKEAE